MIDAVMLILMLGLVLGAALICALALLVEDYLRETLRAHDYKRRHPHG